MPRAQRSRTLARMLKRGWEDSAAAKKWKARLYNHQKLLALALSILIAVCQFTISVIQTENVKNRLNALHHKDLTLYKSLWEIIWLDEVLTISAARYIQ